MDDLDKVKFTLAASGVWTALFVLAVVATPLPVPQRELWDLRNRIISFIHGLFIFGLSVVSIGHKRTMGDPNDYFDNMLLCISLGYFVYDFFCMLNYGIYDKFILIHHSLVFLGMGTSLYTDVGAVEAIYGIFITEISNPLLHIKEILTLLNQKGSALYLLAELSFFGFYYFGRFIIGIPIVYQIVLSWRTHWVERFAAFMLEMQSFQWGYTMAIITAKRYSEYKARKKTGESLPLINPLQDTKEA